MIFLGTLLLSVLLTIVLVPVSRSLALRWQLVDIPDARKVHVVPIPRCGGIAMALGAFVPIAIWNFHDPFVRAWLVGAAIIVAFGLADDFRDLRPRWKLIGQVAAALVVVFLGSVQIHNLGMLAPDGFALPTWVALPLTVLAIVGVTNAINLSDGLDGLAGGICLLSLCCIGYLAYLEGDSNIGLVALALAGAVFGFLRFNTHPARVFMGDTGSQLLGFTVITLSLSLTQGDTALSPVLPLILLGFPVLDTVTVMVTRIASGRSPFSADRNHFHHILMRRGLHQAESVMVIYLFQLCLVAAAIFFRFQSEWLLLTGYLAFSAMLLLLFRFKFKSIPRPEGFVLPEFRLPISRYFNGVKERGLAIRYAFGALRVGFPLLLVLACLLPRHVHPYGAWAALAFGAAIVALRFWRRERKEDALRLLFYLLIPWLVFESNGVVDAWGWGGELPIRLYAALFILLALLDVAVSKLSMRTRGFRSTPLDFLVVVLAVAAPNLSGQGLTDYHLGRIAAEILVLYFSCEVLLTELRGKVSGLAAATMVALAVLFVRAVTGV